MSAQPLKKGQTTVNIRPLHDRVVVRRLEEETKSEVRPLDVKPGDKVLFGKYSGTEVKLGSEEVLVMREEDIMGVIQD
jgi:chaperonin GroES